MLPASFLAPVFLSAILNSLTVGPELGALPGVRVTHYPTPRPDWKAVVVRFDVGCAPIEFLYLLDRKVHVAFQPLNRIFELVSFSPPQPDGGFYFATLSSVSRCASRFAYYNLHLWQISSGNPATLVQGIPDISESSQTDFQPRYGGLNWRGNELHVEFDRVPNHQDSSFWHASQVRLRLMGNRASRRESRHLSLGDFLEDHFESSGDPRQKFNWDCSSQARHNSQITVRCQTVAETPVLYRELQVEVSEDGTYFKVLSTRDEKRPLQ